MADTEHTYPKLSTSPNNRTVSNRKDTPNTPHAGQTLRGVQGVSEVSNGVFDTPSMEVSGVSPLIEGLTPVTPRLPKTVDNPSRPQGWICDLCTFTYTSPRPLAHPPNHRCAPPGRIPRIRKMTLEETR